MRQPIVEEEDERLVESLAGLLPNERTEATWQVAQHRINARLAALEDTLQMVCPYCARGVPMDPAQPDTTHQANHSKGRGTSYPACRAVGIRALINAARGGHVF